MQASPTFRITLEGATFPGDDEAHAPLGLLPVGESAWVRFEAELRDCAPVDRTGRRCSFWRI